MFNTVKKCKGNLAVTEKAEVSSVVEVLFPEAFKDPHVFLLSSGLRAVSSEDAVPKRHPI